MKKLLIAVATTILTSSAMANEISLADESSVGKFYVRADAGASIFTKLKYSGVTLKPKTTTVFDIGFGMQLTSNFRGEVVLSNHGSQNLKGSDTNSDSTTSIKSKSYSNALMAKGYYDIYNTDEVEFFLGGGLGLAQVNETINKEVVTTTTLASGNIIATNNLIINGVRQTPAQIAALNRTTPVQITTTTEIKKKSTSLAYSLAIGTAFRISEAAKLDIQYNFSDFGKAKAVKHCGHTITTGLRFSI